MNKKYLLIISSITFFVVIATVLLFYDKLNTNHSKSASEICSFVEDFVITEERFNEIYLREIDNNNDELQNIYEAIFFELINNRESFTTDYPKLSLIFLSTSWISDEEIPKIEYAYAYAPYKYIYEMSLSEAQNMNLKDFSIRKRCFAMKLYDFYLSDQTREYENIEFMKKKREQLPKSIENLYKYNNDKSLETYLDELYRVDIQDLVDEFKSDPLDLESTLPRDIELYEEIKYLAIRTADSEE